MKTQQQERQKKPLPQELLMRTMNQDDLPFFIDTYINAIYFNSYVFQDVRHKIFEASRKPILKELLNKSKVVVLCHENEPTEIVGWIMWDHWETTLVVHFIYVKSMYRNKGFARALLDETGYEIGKRAIWCSSWSNSVSKKWSLNRRYKLYYYPDILISREITKVVSAEMQ